MGIDRFTARDLHTLRTSLVHPRGGTYVPDRNPCSGGSFHCPKPTQKCLIHESAYLNPPQPPSCGPPCLHHSHRRMLGQAYGSCRVVLSVRPTGRGGGGGHGWVGGYDGKKKVGPLSFGSLFKISLLPRGNLFWFWVGGWVGLESPPDRTHTPRPPRHPARG